MFIPVKLNANSYLVIDFYELYIGRLVLTLTILVALTVWCVLYPSRWIADLLELETIPFNFRVFILCLALGNLGLSLVCEKYLFVHIASFVSFAFKRVRDGPRAGYAPLAKTHKKIYKRVQEEIGP